MFVVGAIHGSGELGGSSGSLKPEFTLSDTVKTPYAVISRRSSKIAMSSLVTVCRLPATLAFLLNSSVTYAPFNGKYVTRH